MNGVQQHLLRRHLKAFLVGSHSQHHEIAVAVAHQRCKYLIHLCQTELRHHLLCQLIFNLNAGDSFVVQEGTYIFAAVRVILLFGTVVEQFLQVAQHLQFRAIQLALCEAMHISAIDLCQNSLHCLGRAALLGHYAHIERLRHLRRDDKRSVFHISTFKRTFRLQRQFVQTLVQHPDGDVLGRFLDIHTKSVVQAVGRGGVLPHQIYAL